MLRSKIFTVEQVADLFDAKLRIAGQRKDLFNMRFLFHSDEGGGDSGRGAHELHRPLR